MDIFSYLDMLITFLILKRDLLMTYPGGDI